MTQMTTYTAEQIIAIGGREWTGHNGQRRIYLNNWHQLAGLEIERYKSGSIRFAAVDGEQISNTKAAKVAAAKVWFDMETGQLRHTIRRAAEEARVGELADVLISNLIAAIRRAGARN